MVNGILIDERDNVAVVLKPMEKQELIRYMQREIADTVRVLDDIPIYHKIAVRGIAKGPYVIKYGEIIGIAMETIRRGQHVHIHNIESTKKNEGE